MKSLLFLPFLFIGLMSSCVNKDEQPIQSKITTPALKNGEYVMTKGPLAGLIRNLGFSKEEAMKVNDIRKKYNKKIGLIPKLADGTNNRTEIQPFLDQKKDEIRKYLGKPRYAQYVAYNAWYQQEKEKKNNK